MALNADYTVLICVNSKCKQTLEPSASPRHLRNKHKTAIELQKQVEQYVQGFPYTYT